jgi:SNF2 family DNA or RNA helicase
MKEDVEKSIAPKEETIIEVDLTEIQRKYYKAIYEKNFSFLVKGVKGSNVGSMMNVMLQLRKCCNHPYLINGLEDSVLTSLPRRTVETEFDALIKSSGKMVLIDKLLPKLKSQGHKVLIFSQMVRYLSSERVEFSFWRAQ